MAISFRKYIDIISVVGGVAQVPLRELIGRLFSVNPLIPTGSYLEFETLAEVGSYFGTTSDEYKRARFYFTRVSKNGTLADKISFARWVDADQAPQIYGAPLTLSLNELKTITTGAFSLTLGVDTHVISGLDFSGAANLAAIATIIQTAIRTQTGTMWTAATVTYDATRGSFDLVGGSAIAAVVSVQAPGSGTDITFSIGWLPNDPILGAIWSDGALEETITETLTLSANASDNFGSFLFMPSLTLDQIVEAATWNAGENNKYMYVIPVSADNASAYRTALQNIGGNGVTLAPLSTEYPEMLPMIILSSTDYTQANSVQNYMFQQADLTPSVSSTETSDTYDGLLINYYGRTQSAGTNIDFYQRGVLNGLSTDPSDMSVYANEIWLKDDVGSSLMNLQLALTEIPANAQGRAQILTVIQQSANRAVNNGTISVGKILTDTQKATITMLSGDPKAWYQVQNIGYWYDCNIAFEDPNYTGNYILIYSKNDVIRKINGRHVLI